MTRDDKEIVSAVQLALAGKVGQDRFDIWFGANTRFRVERDSLWVRIPNRFYLDWLRKNFRAQLEAACLDVVGRVLRIEFEVDPSLAAQPPVGQRPSEGGTPDARTGASATRVAGAAGNSTRSRKGAETDGAFASNGAKRASGRDTRSGVHTAAARSMVALGDSTAGEGAKSRGMAPASLAEYVVGSSNSVAHLAATQAVEKLGHASPVVLYGPTSVGKTHLMEGVLHACRERFPRAQAVYLTAEQFTGQFLEALRGAGTPSFRRKYRGVQLMLIDDIQFFSGKKATTSELLHTIDAFVRDGRQLVVALDRAPHDLTDIGPELKTRLQAGLVCRITPPDEATRRGITRSLARRLEISAPDDVCDFIASRISSHARELAGALKSLRLLSGVEGAPITLEMASRALGESMGEGRVVKLDDIEQAVCEVFGVTSEFLHSTERTQSATHHRMLAMWLARKHTRAALSEICRFFGQRSHSTVIAAQKRIDDWVAGRTQLRLPNGERSVADAIRKVESRMRAG